MRRVKLVELHYNYFEPGTLVTPTSPRHPLDMGKQYVVTQCIEPRYEGDEGVVFVQGRDLGVTSNYLRDVNADEPEAEANLPAPLVTPYTKEMRVIALTNNPAEYPECVADSEEFPCLVGYVQDEMDLFVVDPDREGGFWCADEFFHCVGVKRFYVNPDELK